MNTKTADDDDQTGAHGRRVSDVERRGATAGPTQVVELLQAPNDVVRVATFRLHDVHDVSRLAGKRQHVELQLHLVAVQLEGGTWLCG